MAPRANAASVQAAKSTPRRLNSCGASAPSSFSAKNGWQYQENSRLNAPAAAVTAIASSASLATAQRSRPQPWVQANRNVPVSSSRASSGAPTNTPTSTGITSRMTATSTAVLWSLTNGWAVTSQAADPAGWQAVTAA